MDATLEVGKAEEDMGKLSAGFNRPVKRPGGGLLHQFQRRSPFVGQTAGLAGQATGLAYSVRVRDTGDENTSNFKMTHYLTPLVVAVTRPRC